MLSLVGHRQKQIMYEFDAVQYRVIHDSSSQIPHEFLVVVEFSVADAPLGYEPFALCFCDRNESYLSANGLKSLQDLLASSARTLSFGDSNRANSDCYERSPIAKAKEIQD